MRAGAAVVLFVCLGSAAASAAQATGKGESTDRCVNACIAAQRTCVVKAVTLADKTKCTRDNASCSTKCPLPNHGAKQPK